MTAISGAEAVSRRDLILPRSLAVILFSLAALIGLPACAATTVHIILGNWQPALLLAATAPLVWGLVWLGRRLWFDRGLPTAFVFAFAALINITAASTLFLNRQWVWALVMVSTSALLLLQVLPSPVGLRQKPPKPKALDDLA
jgi:hypothetical protein